MAVALDTEPTIEEKLEKAFVQAAFLDFLAYEDVGGKKNHEIPKIEAFIEDGTVALSQGETGPVVVISHTDGSRKAYLRVASLNDDLESNPTMATGTTIGVFVPIDIDKLGLEDASIQEIADSIAGKKMAELKNLVDHKAAIHLSLDGAMTESPVDVQAARIVQQGHVSPQLELIEEFLLGEDLRNALENIGLNADDALASADIAGHSIGASKALEAHRLLNNTGITMLMDPVGSGGWHRYNIAREQAIDAGEKVIESLDLPREIIKNILDPLGTAEEIFKKARTAKEIYDEASRGIYVVSSFKGELSALRQAVLGDDDIANNCCHGGDDTRRFYIDFGPEPEPEFDPKPDRDILPSWTIHYLKEMIGQVRDVGLTSHDDMVTRFGSTMLEQSIPADQLVGKLETDVLQRPVRDDKKRGTEERRLKILDGMMKEYLFDLIGKGKKELKSKGWIKFEDRAEVSEITPEKEKFFSF